MHYSLMRAYSVDLRKKIVDAIRHGRPTVEVARIFGVGISSVKRYMKMAQEEGSLDPKKAPGKKRKLDEIAMKLLEENLRARPTATYEQRAEFLDKFLGVRGDQVHHLPDDQAPGLLPKKIGRRERE